MIEWTTETTDGKGKPLGFTPDEDTDFITRDEETGELVMKRDPKREDNDSRNKKYIGQWRDGHMHGRGVMVWPGKWSYVGEF